MKLIAFLLTFFVLGCSIFKPKTELTGLSSNITQTKSDDDPILGAHILQTMAIVQAKLSPVKRQILAQQLISIAHNMFVALESMKAWITILAIESRFDSEAVSEAGAVGIGQIMPQFFVGNGRICGMMGLQPEDIKDPVINATVSACLFRYLLESVPDGNVTLALVAYNSGLYSDATKGVQKLTAINKESSNYIVKYLYLKEKVEANIRKDSK